MSLLASSPVPKDILLSLIHLHTFGYSITCPVQYLPQFNINYFLDACISFLLVLKKKMFQCISVLNLYQITFPPESSP